MMRAAPTSKHSVRSWLGAATIPLVVGMSAGVARANAMIGGDPPPIERSEQCLPENVTATPERCHECFSPPDDPGYCSELHGTLGRHRRCLQRGNEMPRRSRDLRRRRQSTPSPQKVYEVWCEPDAAPLPLPASEPSAAPSPAPSASSAPGRKPSSCATTAPGAGDGGWVAGAVLIVASVVVVARARARRPSE
jgi:hypothetical protein